MVGEENRSTGPFPRRTRARMDFERLVHHKLQALIHRSSTSRIEEGVVWVGMYRCLAQFKGQLRAVRVCDQRKKTGLPASGSLSWGGLGTEICGWETDAPWRVSSWRSADSWNVFVEAGIGGRAVRVHAENPFFFARRVVPRGQYRIGGLCMGFAWEKFLMHRASRAQESEFFGWRPAA